MIKGFQNACRSCLRLQMQIRYSSNESTTSAQQSATDIKAAWRERRNLIFENERKRQENEIGRIEKVIVKYKPWDPDAKPTELRMNKYLSTPYDCTKHLNETLVNESALAMVDGKPWDLQKPFESDCELELLTMKQTYKTPALNNAFWRTCSLMLGSMIEKSFKDEIAVYLHSFPPPNIRSGSFTYDAVLDLPDWKPSEAELRAMAAVFVNLARKKHLIERLEVSESVALDMFQDNPFKCKQIPDIASANEGKVTLYRIVDHIDMSRGPMVGYTGIIGKASMGAVHRVQSAETERLYRFQGVALPSTTKLNHVAWGILEKDSRIFNNTAWSQSSMPVSEDEEMKRSVAAKN